MACNLLSSALTYINNFLNLAIVSPSVATLCNTTFTFYDFFLTLTLRGDLASSTITRLVTIKISNVLQTAFKGLFDKIVKGVSAIKVTPEYKSYSIFFF